MEGARFDIVSTTKQPSTTPKTPNFVQNTKHQQLELLHNFSHSIQLFEVDTK